MRLCFYYFLMRTDVHVGGLSADGWMSLAFIVLLFFSSSLSIERKNHRKKVIESLAPILRCCITSTLTCLACLIRKNLLSQCEASIFSYPFQFIELNVREPIHSWLSSCINIDQHITMLKMPHWWPPICSHFVAGYVMILRRRMHFVVYVQW